MSIPQTHSVAVLLWLACMAVPGRADVVINEIHYRPLEVPVVPPVGQSSSSTFNSDGSPVIDLTEDVHEFIELHNTGAAAVAIGNWTLEGGVAYTFPGGATIQPGQFLVVAKSPARLAAIPQYGLSQPAIFGPYTGELGNQGDTVELNDATGNLIDSVTYSARSPWPMAARGLGADDEFTLIDPLPHQHRGRSLERISGTWDPNDPANWLASALASGPTPGRINNLTRATPKPVVLASRCYQANDESSIIRANQPARVDCTFSPGTVPGSVSVEYFLDNIDSYSETRSLVAMTALGGGQFTATIPGQADRSIVRYRIRANRGDGDEIVWPREDDPKVVPVGLTVREAWKGYLVTPVRTLTAATGVNLTPRTSTAAYEIFVRSGDIATNPGAYDATKTLSKNTWPLGQSVHQTSTGPITAIAGAPTAGGSGYTLNDILTVAGGSGNATVRASVVTGGVVVTVQLVSGGTSGYATGVGKATSGGTGTGCTINITGVQLPVGGGNTLRRVTATDSSGIPRAEPYFQSWDAAGNFKDPLWNGTVPAIMGYNGEIWDIQFRYHGSRYRRNENRQAYKISFPDFAPFENQTEMFETDKDENSVWGPAIFREVGIPASYLKWVDLYVNGAAKVQRLEQFIQNDDLIDRFNREYRERNPGAPSLEPGETYKVKGASEGAYGGGNGSLLAQYGAWAPWVRYWWTYPIQSQKWKGSWTLLNMFNAHNTARASDAALKTYLTNNWDVDRMLTYIALRNWACVWDDGGQNYYLWQQPNTKWAIIPWDHDAEYASKAFDTTIYSTANYFKESFLRAGTFRNEYNQRMFLLNNTLLTPAGLQAIGVNIDATWVANRNANVNSQLGLGTFHRPNKPTNQSPAAGGNSVPGPSANFVASAYSYSTTPARAHASSTWEVWPSNGTWRAPVYKASSTTNLTSLPIPFDLLALGQTYYWRVTYTDIDGHPSLPSDQTTFTYGLSITPVTILSIDATTQWKYHQTAAPADDAQGRMWKQAAYDDSAWPSGAALFYNETAALPEQKRTPLTLGRTTYYFRTHFDFPEEPVGVTLKLRHITDDGIVVYINGTEVYRWQVTANPVLDTSTASAGVGDAAYLGPIVIPSTSLVRGDNVIAVETHQVSVGSNDVVFGASLEAIVSQIFINEVQANNRSTIANGGEHPDWIELYNGSAQTVDLGGMSLSDDPGTPGKYVFPAGTAVPAQGYLIVWCDNDTAAPGLHTGFGLNKGGQVLAVFDVAGMVRDVVTFGPQAADLSIGRFPNGSDTWTLVNPSPAGANASAPTLASPTAVVINEWMAKPASGGDWFELYNPNANPAPLAGLWLSDDPANKKITQLPALSFIGGKGFFEFTADSSALGGGHVNFSLGANGDMIILSDSTGTIEYDRVTFGAQQESVSQGRFPDGGTPFALFPDTSSPGESNWLPVAGIVINEALSASTSPIEDMIELWNTGASTVDASGWFLSDSSRDLKKFQIPAGTTFGGGAYRVFYESQFNAGANPFSLDSTDGDAIYLSVADAGGNLTGYRVQVKFGGAAPGVSFGRIVNANGEHFAALTERTFPGANAAPAVGPVVINEMMYHPPDLAGGVDNVGDEFIELHNITFLPVALSDPVNPANRWRLRDAVDFSFPAGTTIPAGGYILVVSFDPADTARLAAFRTTYGLATNVPVHGPWSGRLANSDNSIELAKPLPPVGGLVPWVLVDKVHYHDNTPWPAAADGGGASLQRIDRTSFGNDPAVWTAGTPTGGTNNLIQPAMGDGDTDDDGLPDWWENLYTFNPAVAGEQNLDSDADGANNGAEFAAGTNPRDPADVFKGGIIADGAAAIVISFTAKPGLSYTVQHAASPGGPWETLAHVPAEGGSASQRIIDTPDVTSDARRFYRIVTPQQP